MVKKLLIISMVCLLISTGCAGISIKTDPDRQNFETIGDAIGKYIKIKHERTALKTLPWVEGVLSMSDLELVEQDPLGVAYDYLLKTFPDDAELLLLAKVAIDSFGISVTVDGKIEENEYVKIARALLRGYLKGVK